MKPSVAVMCLSGAVWAASILLLWSVNYRLVAGVLLAFTANNLDQRVREMRRDEHVGGKR